MSSRSPISALQGRRRGGDPDDDLPGGIGNEPVARRGARALTVAELLT
ncbi:hypothetical protein [Nannocystis bainbridge]|uniref:Uncharacterized protein n=1 Tax=Nannocystis bainbridge TaxID=2995303 RepID=A0ABT5DXA1_9BACT|nr:hypothetical protein [Nannocystis bainbridge]MDC0717076.1 hypothetical protein [Nannocystis bainbridge]